MHNMLHVRYDWYAEGRYANTRECGGVHVRRHHAARRAPPH